MASNYHDVIGQLRAAGLKVDRLQLPTGARPKRTAVQGRKGTPGWYSLREIRTAEGDDLIVGSFGIWQGDDCNTCEVELGDRKLNKDQVAALRKSMAAARKAAEASEAKVAAEAARHAAKAWSTYSEEGDSPYLTAKGVSPRGVRFTGNNEVVVPIQDTNGKIHGLQFVRTADQSRLARRPGKEIWPKGARVKGHFALVGDAPTWIVLVAEGYATARSINQATGLPVLVAFNANNIGPVARAANKRWPRAYKLLCADDDSLQRCGVCDQRVDIDANPLNCPGCGQPHKKGNAGISQCSTVALELGAEWVAPRWEDPSERVANFMATGRKITDFNDLHAATGLLAVQNQIEAKLLIAGFAEPEARGAAASPRGAGGGSLRPIHDVDELLSRFALIYGAGGMCFDREEHCRVANSDVRDACGVRELHRDWMEHPGRVIVRQSEVGFDPTETKPHITCNLWGGWPTKPEKGNCDYLLDLLLHMCGAESDRQRDLYHWVLCWLAYPIQHPGAKMKTCLVIHGPQGTGKNLFFETILDIFGEYGRVIGQAELEDKFNDWASRMLFMLADEVVARADLWQVKNKLKAFITGDRIRINPKGASAYDEANHCNVVFLSNEAMPVVLEEDDRRHAVIWTPEKLDRDFYTDVKRELKEGGAAALHHYLLHYPLGDFDPGTEPPVTQARTALIDQGMDNMTRFVKELWDGEILECKIGPVKSQHLFDCYVSWCRRTNNKPTTLTKLVQNTVRRFNAESKPRRFNTEYGPQSPRRIITWEADPCPDGMAEIDWVSDGVARMERAIEAYRGVV